MLFRNLKVLRYAGIFLFAAMLCSVLAYPFLRGESAPPGVDDLQKQMEQLKSEMQSKGATPALVNRYSLIEKALSKCGFLNQLTEPTIKSPFAPAATLCINGSLAVADPTWIRPGVTSNNGTGIGACPGSNPAIYDFYSFNLTGCTVFPTLVRMTLCGPAGCVNAGNVDAILYLYRNVAAGDTLSANGGLPSVFNPASPCTNFRGANDSLSGGASSTPPNGNACTQSALPPQTCEGACAGATSLAGFQRKLGNGRFTVVVSGASTTDFGNYNLYVEAASAGCSVALAPSAASATIGGQVRTSGGTGISKATITLSGNGIETMQTRTNGFGYYSFGEVPVGDNYVLTVNGTKMYTFANPTRVVSLEGNISDADFVSEQK